MDQSLPSTVARPSIFPWLAFALVVILGAGAAFWLNQKIESVATPVQQTGANDTKQAIAGLQQAVVDIRASQQKLGEQMSQLQRAVATDQEERKLLSDQVGALSSRVDRLTLAPADVAPQSQKGQRSKR
ncbi:hypothetical protein [Bradyrhizobium liaoningense]|uniref:hypothetical protein n=1 Tax=Bradyrhizobium liaoningense TaxID=43992 RepID=UPI001BAA3501|nr:hypothetical protein [Bradyrhizobium liaoningense]MBR0903353.1 hypothetical protein [Bradyrhizobium liaoningense]